MKIQLLNSIKRDQFSVAIDSVIPVTLQTTINSDLPGAIIGKVRQSVFDSLTGSSLLIPQGSTLLGQYDSNVTYGQNRMLVVWQRLVFPNGDSFQLDGQPGVDGLGTAGLKDRVDSHWQRLIGGSLMYSILGAAGSLQVHHHDREENSLATALGDSIAQRMSETGMTFANKNLNVQPTLIARAGMRFNVLLRKDLVFPDSYCE